jgi:NADPH-dependent curcumin reductase CurA
MGGRVVLCGLVSQYNSAAPTIGYDLMPIVLKRGKIQGFILFDHLDRLGEASMKLGGWLAEGKIKYHSHIVDGLENALEGFKLLFKSGGAHRGKLMVRVDPSAS